MERMSMLSIILLVLLIQAEGGTLKMKSKSSKEKETVEPHIVRNPGDTSVVRGERVFLDCEVKIKIGDNKELSCSDHEGTFKWTLNGKPVEGESGKVLSIEDFTADFDNSVVRCLQEKVNGETRILRQFKLLTEKADGKGGSQVRKPVQL